MTETEVIEFFNLTSPKIERIIHEQQVWSEVELLGIRGTPTFLINDSMYTRADFDTLEEFKLLVENERERLLVE